ncbi:MAG TPA: acyltransferase [Paraburkholderia sp.]|nr:acyltransferase [Paraburkholderia sp.]
MSDLAPDVSASTVPRAMLRPEAAGKEHVIDAMRGFAALLVAYFHCRQITWVGMRSFHHTVGNTFDLNALVAYLTLPVAWGSAGVPIFFVISGYCIHRGAARRLASNRHYRLDAMNFWARRFVRIYPVLIAALLFTFALDLISFRLPLINPRLGNIGLYPFLVNLLSLQGVAGATYGSNGALWTLSLEVQFYAIYPLLFALRRRIGMSSMLVIVAGVNVVSAYVLEPRDIQFFTSYWLSWTLGAWIAEAKARSAPGTRSQSRASTVWHYAMAALITALGCIAFNFGQFAAFQLWAIGFATWLYKALDRPAANRQPSAPIRLLSRLGDFSFSLYIIHLPLFVLLSSLLYRSALQLSIWPSFAFTLVTLPIAYGLYRLVELPAQRWSASIKTHRKSIRRTTRTRAAR